MGGGEGGWMSVIGMRVGVGQRASTLALRLGEGKVEI